MNTPTRQADGRCPSPDCAWLRPAVSADALPSKTDDQRVAALIALMRETSRDAGDGQALVVAAYVAVFGLDGVSRLASSLRSS